MPPILPIPIPNTNTVTNTIAVPVSRYGHGKEANETAAAEHYLIAASRRSQQAAFALGYMHQFGKVYRMCPLTAIECVLLMG